MTASLDEILILSKDSKGLALRSLLQTALNSPQIFHLTQLLHLPPPPSDCPSMPFFKLVDIYHDGDVEGWKKWKGENKISGVGDNFEAKFNVMAFLHYTVVQPSPTVPLSGLCAHLSLPQDKAEATIRTAIYEGFYSGKISHIGGGGEDYVAGNVTYDFGWKGEGEIEGILEGLKAVRERVRTVQKGLKE